MSSHKDSRATLAAKVYKARQERKHSVVCPISGIAYTISIEDMPAAALRLLMQAPSPYSNSENVQRLIGHGSLSEYSNHMLAGFFLTLARRAISLKECTAAEANALISTEDHAFLCKAVRTVAAINKTSWAYIPAFNPCSEGGSSVSEWLKLAAPYSLFQADANSDKVTVLSKLTATQVALAKAATKQKLAPYEIEFSKSATAAEAESEFKDSKKQAKELWSGILDDLGDKISKGLRDIMAVLLKGQNLNSCNPQLRAKIVSAITALPHKQGQALARLVKETYNPYSLFAKDNDILLEDADLQPSKPTTGRSLAEIIAAAKAKKAADQAKQDGLEDF